MALLKLMSLPQIAARANISLPAVHKWVANGLLVPAAEFGRQKVFHEKDAVGVIRSKGLLSRDDS